MSERGVGSRLSQLTTALRAGRRRLPHQGREDVRAPAPGTPTRYLVAARSRGGPVGGLAVPGAGRRRGPDGGADLGLARHARHLARTTCTWTCGAGGRAARRGRGAGAAGRPADAALAGGELRRRLRRGGPGRGGRSGGALPAPAAWPSLPAVRARIGRADAAVAAARLVVAEAARRVDEAPGRAGDQPLGVAGQAARRHHRRGGGGVHAGGGRHVGHPPRASAGAALPRRPVRLAAAGDLGRLRRLARHRGARRRPGRATERRRDGERRRGARPASGSAHPPPLRAGRAVGGLLRPALRRRQPGRWPSGSSPTPAW